MASVVLNFAESAYSADAIQRAAYKFCGHFSIELQRRDDDYLCTLHFLDEGEPDPAILSDFRTEVLDQVLRERIRWETAAARNVILAAAFSNIDVPDD